MSIRIIAHSIHGDLKGGVLPITAGFILTMVAVTGAGLDMGRAYMAKSRLQSACDAGVLAGRKAQKTSTYDANAEQAAKRTFDVNFAKDAYNAKNVKFKSERLRTSEIKGTAEATISTSIMYIFGMTKFDFQVTCEARLDLPNTDIMFVLDTTGSMAQTNAGDTVTRIDALRRSVKDFHATIQAAQVGDTQVRFGFVPYSSTVNVGRLLQRNWMVDRWTYDSKRYTKSTTGTSNGTTIRNYQPVSGNQNPIVTDTTGLSENCVAPPLQPGEKDLVWEVTVTGPLTTDPVTGEKYEDVSIRTHGVSYTAFVQNGSCVIRRNEYNEKIESARKYYITYNYETNYYSYEPIEYDVSPLKGGADPGTMAGSSITAPIGYKGANVTVNWDGCIEERDTVRSSDPDTAPTGALDLDINTVPNPGKPATQWRPYLPRIATARLWGNHETEPDWTAGPIESQWMYMSYGEGGTRSLYAACPSQARKLGSMDAASIASYVDGLVATGATHHDIGMIWGARLLSPNGLFRSENATAANGQSISRHLILMTDGEMDVQNKTYNAYGIHGNDFRQTNTGTIPTDTDLNRQATARFLAVCEEAKRNNMTIWVIAFGTTLTSELKQCSTGGRAFQANNASELNNAFQEIATKIAGLRITH